MAWIEVHQGIFRHRKTVSLGHLLDVPRMSAGGHIISLWLWALDNAPNGDLAGIAPAVIAFGAEWDGDPTVFVDRLVDVGFLDRDHTSLSIHDWYDYAGRLIEARRKDAERKRVQRTSAGQSTGRPDGHPVDVPRKSRATVPDRTLPNQTMEPINSPQWLETLRGIEGWTQKGEVHLESLLKWVENKAWSEDQLERSAIGFASVQDKTLAGYRNMATAFQRRVNEGFDFGKNGHGSGPIGSTFNAGARTEEAARRSEERWGDRG